jgi:trk system potassium uptake protein TrkA
MYIIITGGGMIGSALAKALFNNKHDVVVIEPKKEVCDKLYEETGIEIINGNSSSASILKDAGILKADVLIATSNDDAANLACAILAKSYGVPQVIVRMRNREYAKAYKLAGVNSISSVADLMVNQILLFVERPKIKRMMTIGNGKANIYSIIVPINGAVIGKTVQEIAKSEEFPNECIIVAMYNQKKDILIIPRGNRKIFEQDEIYLISSPENIAKVSAFLTKIKES